MPAGISFDSDAPTQGAYDVLTATLAAYPNNKKFKVLQERHKYHIMNRWMRDDRRVVKAGKSIDQQVIIDENGSAKMVEAYETHEPNNTDVLATMSLPWRFAQADWAIENSEILMNGTSPQAIEKLTDLVDVRRTATDYSMANKLEAQGFSAPTGTADKKNAHGILYWLPPITSAQVAAGTGGDHIGGNPVGFVDTAGIDASAAKYHLWRSYVDVWDNLTGITESDVDKLVQMHRHLDFEVPMNATDWADDFFQDFAAYVSEARLKLMERKARMNNDSLGADLGKWSGQTMIKGTPLRWAKDLDDIASDPLIMINHAHWFTFVMEGMVLKETTVPGSVTQHKVTTTFTDLGFNFGTLNRRQCGGRIDFIE